MHEISYVVCEDFDDRVIDSKIPVLVDFTASWCGPCKAITPVLDQVCHEYGDRVLFVKVNVDSDMELCEDFQVQSIPTFLLFQGGSVVKRAIGSMDRERLVSMLEEVL